VMARGGREFFITGHFEYSPNTLDKEYRRDAGKRDDVELPKNYYRDNDPAKGPVVTWRAHAFDCAEPMLGAAIISNIGRISFIFMILLYK
jgi:homoserine O-succinyltransferase